MKGFLVVDKPPGVTSHDVVGILRAVTGVKKVGHTGTLDPFATGVLAVAFGGATRAIQFLDESLKVYDATIALGERRDTGDPTGDVIETAAVPTLTRDAVVDVLQGFVGELMQTPPPYSAVKYKGKPLYWYARRGESPEVPARRITVFGLELLELGETSIRVLIRCSRGSYARVLAEDIARALGTVGHLVALARHRSGPFAMERAISAQQLGELVSGEAGRSYQDVLFYRGPREGRVAWKPRDTVVAALASRLVSLEDALSYLPSVRADERQWRAVKDGRAPTVYPSGVGLGQRWCLLGGDDSMAIVRHEANGPVLERLLV